MALVTEDQVELQSIDWFKDLGYQYVCGYDIAPDGDTPERTDYRSVVLKIVYYQHLSVSIPRCLSQQSILHSHN